MVTGQEGPTAPPLVLTILGKRLVVDWQKPCLRMLWHYGAPLCSRGRSDSGPQLKALKTLVQLIKILSLS